MRLVEVVNIARAANELDVLRDVHFQDTCVKFYRGPNSGHHREYHLIPGSDGLVRDGGHKSATGECHKLEDILDDHHVDWQVYFIDCHNGWCKDLTEHMWFKLIQHNPKWNMNGEPFNPYNRNHQESILMPTYDYDLLDKDLCQKTYLQLVAIDRFVEESAKCSPHPDF